MFVRTERLLLRPGFREDASALLRAIGDDLVVRQVADWNWPSSLAEAEALIGSQSSQTLPNLLVFRRTRGAPKLVGAAGLKTDSFGETELRLWITREHWGLGFATEAANGMIALARDGLRLHRLVSGHFLDSLAGERVLRKLGFRPNGVLVQRATRCRTRPAPWRKYELRLSEAHLSKMNYASPQLVAA